MKKPVGYKLRMAARLMQQMLVHIDGMPGSHVGPPPHIFTGPQRELAHRVVVFLRSIGVNALAKCCGKPTL